jgi:magnesium transporter
MIAIVKSNQAGLESLASPVTGCWLRVIDPTPDEIARLEALGLPLDFITYPLDIDERPRTEREDSKILILLRIPYFQGESFDVPYITIPLGIILTDQYLVTVCKRNNDIIQEFSSGRARDFSTTKHSQFVLRLLLGTATKYLSYLREISRVVEALEDKLQLSIRNQQVLDLLKYEKSLTYFTTALRANELMLERLQRSQLFKSYPDDEDLLEDVITENQQAIEMTNIQSNILSGMMDAFASIISNNLNQVIKLLTSITLVLSFPAMVAAFYGMNVALPLDDHPLAFGVVIAVALSLSLIVAVILKKLDWF